MSAWTVSALLTDDASISQATNEEVEAMLDELHTEWKGPTFLDNDGIRSDALNAWACERFDINIETVTIDELNRNTKIRIKQLKKLFDEIQMRKMEGEVQEKLARIAKIMREARNTIQSTAILFKQLDPVSSYQMDKHKWNPDSFFQFTLEDEKANSFQKILIAVLKRIAVAGLRRLDEDCYEQIMLDSGESSGAWKRKTSIKDFIYANIQKETDYEEWKHLTNPHDNGEKVVNHLIASAQIEFPVIEMNRYLWSYKNGIYNVDQDMFYPFSMAIFTRVEQITKRGVQTKAKAYNPTEGDGYYDFDFSSPCYEIDGVKIWQVEKKTVLHPVSFFKIGDALYLNDHGRESWPRLAYEIQTFRRGMHIGHINDVTTELVKTLPICSLDVQPNMSVASEKNGVKVWMIDGITYNLMETSIFYVDGNYYKNSNGHPVWKTSQNDLYVATAPTTNDVAVKYFDTEFRFRITPEEEATFTPDSIVLPEMETIMNAQDLEDDSQKWLVLMLCRLFFPIGYDRWQVVLFVKGVAGSGKSTLAQIIRNFYPPTCVTTLSSNIEAKFGLSAIYKGMVCVCAEVREDFGLDQAEWQSCVSGEEVQIAVKQRTAFAHKWTTPFFWLGNELPNYKNASGSVDRRFFMIEFNKKVFNSDPHLLSKFQKNIDYFQRKGVYLYHEALRKFGEKDIWASGVLGKQLIDWRNSVKLSSDMLYAFLSDTENSKFEYAAHLYMPLEDFKEEYFQFRKQNGGDKVRWTAAHYQAVFTDMSLILQGPDERVFRGTPVVKKWLQGIDLRQDSIANGGGQ